MKILVALACLFNTILFFISVSCGDLIKSGTCRVSSAFLFCSNVISYFFIICFFNRCICFSTIFFFISVSCCDLIRNGTCCVSSAFLFCSNVISCFFNGRFLNLICNFLFNFFFSLNSGINLMISSAVVVTLSKTEVL